MLEVLGFDTLDGLADATVPGNIRLKAPLELDGLPETPLGEFELLEQLKEMASENLVYRSYIGMGYSDTIVPPVVLRNVMENPGWYTQYTPYQAEISQGRLEALLLFQTAISELTGLPLAGSSLDRDRVMALLDERHQAVNERKGEVVDAFATFSDSLQPEQRTRLAELIAGRVERRWGSPGWAR